MKSTIEPLGSEALKTFQTYKIEHMKKARVSTQELHNK